MTTPSQEPTFAVELYFDDDAEQAVKSLRAALYEAGVPPSPRLLDSRPHVSLVGAAASSPEPLIEAVEDFASRSPPLPVTIEAVAGFAGSGHILYLAPTPTRALLEHHAAFFATLEGREVAPSDHYRPGRWIPHCTLEMGIPPEALGRAFAVIREALQPIEGRFVEIGMVSPPPAQWVRLFPLSG